MQRVTFINYDAKHRQTTGQDLSTINTHAANKAHRKRRQDAEHLSSASSRGARQTKFALFGPGNQFGESDANPFAMLPIRAFISQVLDTSIIAWQSQPQFVPPSEEYIDHGYENQQVPQNDHEQEQGVVTLPQSRGIHEFSTICAQIGGLREDPFRSFPIEHQSHIPSAFDYCEHSMIRGSDV